MYLLDTNVVSELRKLDVGRADRNVVAWARLIAPSATFLSVMTVMELELGTSLLERRDAAQGAILRRWLDTLLQRDFRGRILPLDEVVARRCARLHVPDRRSERDAWIAATAMVHGLSVVTRNVADFLATGVALVDPWRAAPA